MGGSAHGGLMFINKYVDYVKEQTDAPSVYQVAMAYFIVSAIVNKNCWVPFGYKKLYPNIYLLIVGPSTLHRKSWSRGIGIDLIDSVLPDTLIQDTSSRENFIQILAGADRIPLETGILSIDELKGFMDRTKKGQHHQGFIQDLSQLYDGGRFLRQKGVEKMERFDLKSPFLNIVACCSNDWLSDSIQKSDVSGGFLARFIWAVDNSKVTKTSAWPKAVKNGSKSELVSDLLDIGTIHGEFSPDQKAWAFWEKWYVDFRLLNQGGFWDSNYERLTTLGMKLALLRAIMRIQESKVNGLALNNSIIETDIKDAVLFIEDVAASFADIIITSDEEEKMTKKVLLAIRKSEKGLRHQDIYNKVFGMKSGMLGKCLATLLDSECVEIERVGLDSRGRTYHYLKDLG